MYQIAALQIQYLWREFQQELLFQLEDNNPRDSREGLEVAASGGPKAECYPHLSSLTASLTSTRTTL